MSKPSKVAKAIRQLTKLSLKLEETINQTIYEFGNELLVFFVCDGEFQYKGIIILSGDKERIGAIDWYYLDKGMKEYLVLKEN